MIVGGWSPVGRAGTERWGIQSQTGMQRALSASAIAPLPGAAHPHNASPPRQLLKTQTCQPFPIPAPSDPTRKETTVLPAKLPSWKRPWAGEKRPPGPLHEAVGGPQPS